MGHHCRVSVLNSLRRRTRAISFGVLLAVTLAGCSGDGNEGSASPSTTQTTQTTGSSVAAPGSSALQLRPVLVVQPNGCGSLAENPTDDQPVSLSDHDGACYELGPAALTVRRAEAHSETGPDGLLVYVQLNAADTAGLARVFSANLGKQIALVMFGRVQSAPTVRDDTSEGTIAITGIDQPTADRMVKSLSG